ncbi:uncharacterized protein PV06_10088 [Exophiala oligosperma]|uniref:Xylanolytic transcriptional activator regulatory domain-containing protein n=1 Tax=Exophiala oligosperma TaxID=215243 RepID=A0A0D2D4G9_9EURO|nr:uncharacterized protein PV06_10088 [Exophiala oligosperma]KIW38128.1 hypothetical protein PV06_10088 [Exophiala oligosperma]
MVSGELTDNAIEALAMSSATGELRYYGPSSVLAFTTAISSVLRSVRLQGPGMTLSNIRNEAWRNLPRPIPAPLPDQIFGGLLADAYFAHVHPQYPFLHRPTFDFWESSVHGASASNTSPDTTHAYFVYMVYAVGALVSPALSPSSAESLYATGELYFEKVVGLEGLESIQAILCCAMYSMRSSSGVSIWTLSGLALRQCTELGLHRKIPWAASGRDVLATQIQRRVFWVAYNLDRIAAVSTGRPFGIAEDDIDVELPEDVNDEDITPTGLLATPRTSHTEHPTTISAGLHNIRLRRIWVSIQTVIYPTHGDPPQSPENVVAEDLKDRLNSWYAQCPLPQTGNFAFGSKQWFSLTYHHTIILIHRQQLVSHARNNFQPSDDMTPIYLECARSASTLCQMYQELYFGVTVGYTTGALHVLFLGGLTFLYCLWVSEGCRLAYRRDTVAAICTACTVSLVIMTERWSAAQPFRDTFKALSEATQSMLATHDGKETPETLLPVISTGQNPRIPQYLSDIGSLGMCASTEHLITRMISQ